MSNFAVFPVSGAFNFTKRAKPYPEGRIPLKCLYSLSRKGARKTVLRERGKEGKRGREKGKGKGGLYRGDRGRGKGKGKREGRGIG